MTNASGKNPFQTRIVLNRTRKSPADAGLEVIVPRGAAGLPLRPYNSDTGRLVSRPPGVTTHGDETRYRTYICNVILPGPPPPWEPLLMTDVSPRIVVLDSNITTEDVPGRQAFLAGALPSPGQRLKPAVRNARG
jgi:hypothetical protein